MNQTFTFTVTGMTCGHCEQAIARAVKEADPHAEITIDRAANKVVVQSNLARDVIGAAITDEGYAVG